LKRRGGKVKIYEYVLGRREGRIDYGQWFARFRTSYRPKNTSSEVFEKSKLRKTFAIDLSLLYSANT
jgi:hypothetical protein